MILFTYTTSVYAGQPTPDKQKRTPITVFVYCEDRTGHRYPARVTPNGYACP